MKMRTTGAIIISKIIACQEFGIIETRKFPINYILWELRKEGLLYDVVLLNEKEPIIDAYDEIFADIFMADIFTVCVRKEESYFSIQKQDLQEAEEGIDNLAKLFDLSDEDIELTREIVVKMMKLREEGIQKYWGEEYNTTKKNIESMGIKIK